MNRFVFILLLSVTHFLPGRAEEVDGFKVLVEISRSTAEILDKQDSDFAYELIRYLREGGERPRAVPGIQAEVRPLLRKLREASDTSLWAPMTPENLGLTLEFEMPLPMQGWLGLPLIANLEIRVLMKQEEWEKALSLLHGFEPYNRYLRTNGNLLMPSLAHGSRKLLIPQQIKLARKLPVDLLEDELENQLRFLRQLPAPEDQAKGDVAEKTKLGMHLTPPTPTEWVWKRRSDVPVGPKGRDIFSSRRSLGFSPE